jgi:hypothetical protein
VHPGAHDTTHGTIVKPGTPIVRVDELGDLRLAWGAFHMDKPASSFEISFGDFGHLAASLFAFSAMFEICRADRTRRQGKCQRAGFPDQGENFPVRPI